VANSLASRRATSSGGIPAVDPATNGHERSRPVVAASHPQLASARAPRPRLLAPPSTGRRPGAASAAARQQCPPEPLLGAGSSAATHAGQRARGRLAPPAATTGLSSPGHRPARRVTMEEKKGGGADTEEPATGLPHLPSSRLASRQTTAPQAGANPPRTAARAAHTPWPRSASRARQACCRAACVERQGERVHRETARESVAWERYEMNKIQKNE